MRFLDVIRNRWFSGQGGSRRAATLVVLCAAGLLVGLVTAPPAWEYSNSNRFCAETCHTMPPAFDTYRQSVHARVPCVDCHIGRGLLIEQFARKSGHSRLLWATLTNNFEYPIRVSHMRPARDTCELCHFPEKFSTDSLLTLSRFSPNETNDPYTVYLLMHTGGGSSREGLGKGIHWHVENKVEFAPGPDDTQEIPWVRVTHPDGTTAEYRTRDAQPPAPGQALHTMDCIDCHNRITHSIPTPQDSVDDSLKRGTLPVDLPWIRKQAVEVLGRAGVDAAEPESAIRGLVGWYQEHAPEVARTRSEDIALATDQVLRIHGATTFEDQELDWTTHPDNMGHTHWPGCFRCHDGRHQDEQGRAIRLECNICHSIPKVVRPGEAEPMLALATGVEPESHLDTRWIPRHHNAVDASCASCHDITDAGGTSDKGFCSNSQCHGVKWSFAGFEAQALAEDLNLQQVAEAPSAPVAATDVTYATLRPALDRACGSCHGDSATKGLKVTDYASLLKGGASGPAVKKGDPKGSLLVQKLARGHFATLPRKDLDLLSQWITSGAPQGTPVAAAPKAPRGSGWSAVGPALATRCEGCHGRRIANGGLDVSSWETLMKGGRSGPAIRPRDPKGSLLVQKLEKGHFARLEDTEAQALLSWIEAGASGPVADPERAAPAASWSALQGALKGSCGACHGRHGPQKGLTVVEYDALLKGGASGPVVVPGKPEESRIVAILSAGHFASLSEGEMKALRTWIGAGAPRDGAAPPPTVTDAPAGAVEPEPAEADYHSTRTVASDGLPCIGCHARQAAVLGTDHDASVVAVGDRNQTCLSCHDPDKTTAFRMESSGGNPASGRCLTCHNGRQAKKPGYTSHPDVPMTTAGLPFEVTGPSPYYAANGRPAPKGGQGTLTCMTCHEPHHWTWTSDSRPGAAEGNSRSSFLRDPASVTRYCTVCHGEDALPNYSYFHKSMVRKTEAAGAGP